MPCVGTTHRDFVISVVRKQCRIGVTATGGKATGARDEQPMIRIAYDAHKEWIHPVVISDAIVLFTKYGHVFAGHVRASNAIHMIPNVYCAFLTFQCPVSSTSKSGDSSQLISPPVTTDQTARCIQTNVEPSRIKLDRVLYMYLRVAASSAVLRLTYY